MPRVASRYLVSSDESSSDESSWERRAPATTKRPPVVTPSTAKSSTSTKRRTPPLPNRDALIEMEGALKQSAARAAAAAAEVGRLSVHLQKQTRLAEEGRTAAAEAAAARTEAQETRRRAADAQIANDRLRETLEVVQQREREQRTRGQAVEAQVQSLQRTLATVEKGLSQNLQERIAAAARARVAMQALERHFLLGGDDNSGKDVSQRQRVDPTLSTEGCHLLGDALDAVLSVEALLTTGTPPPPPISSTSYPEASALGDRAREAAAARNAHPQANTTTTTSTRAPTKVPLNQMSNKVSAGRKPVTGATAVGDSSSSAAAVEPTRGASHSSSRPDESSREGVLHPSSSSSPSSHFHQQPRSGPSGPLLREYQEAILKARRSADSSRREADELRASLSAIEARVAILQGEADAARNSEAREADRCRAAESTAAHATAKSAGLEQRTRALGAAADEAQRLLKALRHKLDGRDREIARLSEELASLQATRQKELEAAAEGDAKCAEAARTIEALQRQVSQLKASEAALVAAAQRSETARREAAQQASAAVASAQKEAADSSAAKDKVVRDAQALAAALAQAKQDAESAQETVTRVSQERDRLRSLLRRLEEVPALPAGAHQPQHRAPASYGHHKAPRWTQTDEMYLSTRDCYDRSSGRRGLRSDFNPHYGSISGTSGGEATNQPPPPAPSSDEALLRSYLYGGYSGGDGSGGNHPEAPATPQPFVPAPSNLNYPNSPCSLSSGSGAKPARQFYHQPQQPQPVSSLPPEPSPVAPRGRPSGRRSSPPERQQRHPPKGRNTLTRGAQPQAVDSPMSSIGTNRSTKTTSSSSSMGGTSMEAALERDLAELDLEIGGLRASLEQSTAPREGRGAGSSAAFIASPRSVADESDE